MENKYYTPAIEEFHVGFEYEYNSNNTWIHKRTNGKWLIEDFYPSCGEDGDSAFHEVENMLTDNKVRVKCLDQKDIESFGWKYVSGNHRHSRFVLKEEWEIGINLENGSNLITYFDDPFTCVFNGTTKNKSEFKKVLTQIGIS